MRHRAGHQLTATSGRRHHRVDTQRPAPATCWTRARCRPSSSSWPKRRSHTAVPMGGPPSSRPRNSPRASSTAVARRRRPPPTTGQAVFVGNPSGLRCRLRGNGMKTGRSGRASRAAFIIQLTTGIAIFRWTFCSRHLRTSLDRPETQTREYSTSTTLLSMFFCSACADSSPPLGAGEWHGSRDSNEKP